jgi:simple sugar transport system permease protein
MRIERRLEQPRWLSFAVPAAAILLATLLGGLVLLVTGHQPVKSFERLFQSAFTAKGALSATVVSATPLAFTGLCAAVAFRMNLFNIGGEGQLYGGAITGATAGLLLAHTPSPVAIGAMVLAGAAGGALVAAIPGFLRAFLSTNEIITSLMLNYVVGLILTYLIFDTHSYLRDTTGFQAQVFPQGKTLPASATWPSWTIHGLMLPLGFLLAAGVAFAVWALYARTRFGFEVQVIGDSARAARYAGMRTRRKILAVMCLSGALAGIGGASQDGDFRHQLDPRGLTAAGYGYAGIVIAALGRYNPFAVVVLAFGLGGLQNAGYTLQSADFPAGLVGVMQGLILFCALGGELFVRYRVRFERRAPKAPTPAALEPEPTP